VFNIERPGGVLDLDSGNCPLADMDGKWTWMDFVGPTESL